MKIDPYLFFNGRCEEALEFYKAVFDAEQTFLMRYKESPEAPQMPLPPGWEEKVMHASMTIGTTQLMLSDGCGAEAPSFSGFSLSVEMPAPRPQVVSSTRWRRMAKCRCRWARPSFRPVSAW